LNAVFVATAQLFPSLKQRGDFAMRKLGQFALDFLKNEDGPTAVEYAVMLALIIVVCIAAISALGSNASNTFQYVGNKISTTSS
jgi:pilus assembly protein Flp/PilA